MFWRISHIFLYHGNLLTFIQCVFVYFCLFDFGSGFLCVTFLAVLELGLVDQAGLELTGLFASASPSAG